MLGTKMSGRDSMCGYWQREMESLPAFGEW